MLALIAPLAVMLDDGNQETGSATLASSVAPSTYTFNTPYNTTATLQVSGSTVTIDVTASSVPNDVAIGYFIYWDEGNNLTRSINYDPYDSDAAVMVYGTSLSTSFSHTYAEHGAYQIKIGCIAYSDGSYNPKSVAVNAETYTTQSTPALNLEEFVTAYVVIDSDTAADEPKDSDLADILADYWYLILIAVIVIIGLAVWRLSD